MREFTELERFDIEHAQRLTEIINESLSLSYNSKVPDTKISRLILVKEKLQELKKLAAKRPFISITSLDAVEKNIADMEAEYSAAGYYSHTDVDRRNDAISLPAGWKPDYWTFCATLQRRTPLRVLEMHGSVFRGESPPSESTLMHEGIWIPGMDDLLSQSLAPTTMASEIGPIPVDGGTYLQFLKSVRRIAELDTAGVADRRERLLMELSRPEWAEYVRKMGGEKLIANRFFPPFIGMIKGLSDSTIESLWENGMRTAADFARISDAQLLKTRGIGPAKLKTIREACTLVRDKTSEYLDAVER